MDEKKEEQVKQENTTKNNDAGLQPKADDLIERANKAAERVELAIKRHEEVLGQIQEEKAKAILSGRSEAGSQPVKKEETPKEYKDRVMKGNL